MVSMLAKILATCKKYNTIQYNTIQYNTIQYNRIQLNTIQYNTVQYNTIQYNTKSIYMRHFQKAESAYRETLILHDEITIVIKCIFLKSTIKQN